MAIDANYSSVSLLCHGDALKDTRGHALSANGNAAVSSAQKKYGSGSIALDGSGDYISTPAGADFAFGNGDYTVEAFIYLNSVSATLQVIFCSGTVSSDNFFFHLNNAKLSVGTGLAYISQQATTWNTGQWYHVAACRASGTLRLFKDGALLGAVADSTNWVSDGTTQIGVGTAGDYVNGYLDEVRVTKGVARYTSAFTAPTAAFPEGGVVADAASLSLSGQTAGLRRAITVVATAATYSLTGLAATLIRGRQLVAGAASYVSAGLASLRRAVVLGADGAAYASAEPSIAMRWRHVLGVAVARYVLRASSAGIPAFARSTATVTAPTLASASVQAGTLAGRQVQADPL